MAVNVLSETVIHSIYHSGI